MSHPQDSALILLDLIRYGVYFDVKSAFASVSGAHEECSGLLSQPQSATRSLQMHAAFRIQGYYEERKVVWCQNQDDYTVVRPHASSFDLTRRRAVCMSARKSAG